MKGITKWLMGSGLIVVIFLGGYLTISYVGSYRVYAHEISKLPDLVVTEIKCGPGSNLQFTVVNIGPAPLPSGWRAVAEVYFDGLKQGHIDLTRPTAGDITPAAGGRADYLTEFYILRPVEVTVAVDARNEIRELNKHNNGKKARITPVSLPDLVVRPTTRPIGSPGEIITFQVAVKNLGTGIARGTVRPDGSTTDDGYMIDLSLSNEPIRDPVSPHVVPSPYNFVEGMLLKGGRISRTEDLRPGEEKKYSASVEIPNDIKSGKYCIGVSVDPFNKVAEGPPTGELRNTANYRITIR